MPKYLCQAPGCRKIVAQPGRCAGHKARDGRAAEYRKWYKLKVWLTISAFVLRRDPICKACGVKPSTQADHVIPHRGDWNKFADPNNCQGLCDACHGLKTQRGL